jgi:hypothetical protein
VTLALAIPLLSACGASTPDRESAAAPTPSVSTSLEISELDTGPGLLRPNDQLADVDETGAVHVALWGWPALTGGDGRNSRSVCLSLSIANDTERALDIKAQFQPKNGEAVTASSASCGAAVADGSDAISVPIDAGRDVTGSLAYSIPKESGRLVLTGSHLMNYFVEIPAASP